MELNREVAQRVLSIVDHGLSEGMGEPTPGHMCVEAAVCYALGMKHSDQPKCVSPVVRSLKIGLNDRSWSSNAARAKGLRRLAIAQLGTKENFDNYEFCHRLVLLSANVLIPRIIRAYNITDFEELLKPFLEFDGDNCGRFTDGAIYNLREMIRQRFDSTSYQDYVQDALRSLSAMVSTYGSCPHDSSIGVWSVDIAGYTADLKSWQAYEKAGGFGPNCTLECRMARRVTYDEELSWYGEEIVKILVDLKAQGTQWLDLTA